jgi:histone H3/H4
LRNARQEYQSLKRRLAAKVSSVFQILNQHAYQNSSDHFAAKQCIQKVTTDFIIMLTYDMAKKCKREGRKTISTEDLFQSLQFLGSSKLPQIARSVEAKTYRDNHIPGFALFVPYLRLHVRVCRLARGVSEQLSRDTTASQVNSL